jgi:hypothetical protein
VGWAILTGARWCLIWRVLVDHDCETRCDHIRVNAVPSENVRHFAALVSHKGNQKVLRSDMIVAMLAAPTAGVVDKATLARRERQHDFVGLRTSGWNSQETLQVSTQRT